MRGHICGIPNSPQLRLAGITNISLHAPRHHEPPRSNRVLCALYCGARATGARSLSGGRKVKPRSVGRPQCTLHTHSHTLLCDVPALPWHLLTYAIANPSTTVMAVHPLEMRARVHPIHIHLRRLPSKLGMCWRSVQCRPLRSIRLLETTPQLSLLVERISTPRDKGALEQRRHRANLLYQV